MALPLIAAGIGLAGGIGKMFARGKSNRELDRLKGQNPQYQANPLAAQRLAYATALRDARMPGFGAAEQNIRGQAGNLVQSAQRNATDASQVLGMAAAAQGQAQQGFNQLGMQEADFKMRQIDNWEQALQGQIGEQQAEFQDSVRRFGDDVSMEGAKAQNRANMWGDISNMGFKLADFGVKGGFDKFGIKNIFGKKSENEDSSNDGLESFLGNLGKPQMQVDQKKLAKLLKWLGA